MVFGLVGNLRQHIHTNTLIYTVSAKKTQEGTKAQPQAHRKIHTVIHHPHFVTHLHIHTHKEILGELAGTCLSNELVIFSERD